MTEALVLHGVETELDSAIGREFVSDCVRAGEGVIADDDLCLKYEIEPETLAAITRNKSLIKAVRSESERRVRAGVTARELAAKIHAKAPTVLGDILSDKSASPRHRIESAKELRATAVGAGNTENTVNNAEKFIITINLGDDHVEVFEKTIEPAKQLLPANEIKTIDDWGWSER